MRWVVDEGAIWLLRDSPSPFVMTGGGSVLHRLG